MKSVANRVWSSFAYLAIGWVLGLVWGILLVTLLAVGVATTVVVIGVPILAVTLMLVRVGSDAERARAALVLEEGAIPRPPRPRASGFWAGWNARLRDRATWKELGHMLLLGPIGVGAGTLAIGLWSVALAAVTSPIFRPLAPDGSTLASVGAVEIALFVVGGLIVGAIAAAVTVAVAQACAAAARGLLAPDERALLAARVRSVEESRAGAVESADSRLRRLERDLHDGAQHRLAYVAMELDRARTKLAADDPDGAEALLASAHDESKRAMGELRDLVRGIHPSVLADRGLDAAVSGLAQRCPVPVAVDSKLPGRPPTAVEAAAYYVVAESLTNVGKHSGAHHASVTLRAEPEALRVEIADDGGGGAHRTSGSGLEGLAQRVEALDGSLSIASPADEGTTVTAVIPCVW